VELLELHPLRVNTPAAAATAIIEIKVLLFIVYRSFPLCVVRQMPL
jgi:hypothetical protein